ncbi:hypothetical protein O6H91_07G040300 [Diphasiastrum complanatum]|uniref:Uncharacterized protein n=1 Tax=Diphasiastrum complanatum TaxID=34168 RepID=A0ACC2D4Q2_DIPCM|nr:hypothetical protein O6H91_07G040300 [Diphasiastrum complanatum]
MCVSLSLSRSLVSLGLSPSIHWISKAVMAPSFVCEFDMDSPQPPKGMDYSEPDQEILTLSQHETENFEEKVKGFFQEHMHSQEEIRLILDGSGYWDIRDYDEKWLRFRVTKGDLIVLPPGMFHRFTLDEAKYIKALLLYTEVPCRTQHERTEDESTARKLYVDTFLNKRMAIHETQMAVHETQMAALTV